MQNTYYKANTDYINFDILLCYILLLPYYFNYLFDYISFSFFALIYKYSELWSTKFIKYMFAVHKNKGCFKTGYVYMYLETKE